MARFLYGSRHLLDTQTDKYIYFPEDLAALEEFDNKGYSPVYYINDAEIIKGWEDTRPVKLADLIHEIKDKEFSEKAKAFLREAVIEALIREQFDIG